MKHDLSIIKEKANGRLTVQGLDKVLMSAIKICQASEFHQELHDLRNNKRLSPKSNISILYSFLDANIIRVEKGCNTSQ